MVTAAAGSDAAVVLVDLTKIDWRAARVELLPQTRRHALLAQLLRVPSIVFAVNKLDAVDAPQAAFDAVSTALRRFAAEAGIVPAGVVPVSALRGDNVTAIVPGGWYAGPSLLELLEELPSASDDGDGAFVQPVQYVARNESDDGANPERVFWGRIARGRVRAGDEVQVFPSGEHAVVRSVRRAAIDVDEAGVGESAGLVLDRPVDVSRGDWLAAAGAAQPVRGFTATLAWLDTEPAQVGRKVLVRHGHRWAQARVTEIVHRLDIRTLQPTDAHALAVNEIGRVTVELQQPLPLAPYAANRTAGALIVVDPASHRTSGALLVDAAA
jgi:sulfate adenylyltransferase subunit 1